MTRTRLLAAVALTLMACQKSNPNTVGGDDMDVPGDVDAAAPPDLATAPPPDLAMPPVADTHLDVAMNRNDASRTGWYPYEQSLTTSTVGIHRFGKLFSRTVDGVILGQPLYASALQLPDGTTHDVVYVATEHDSVFAFDADDAARTAPLWQVSLGTPVASTDLPGQCPDIAPEIGISSTPAINRAAGVLYVVAKSKASDGSYHQALHALDLGDGHEQLGGPVEIGAVVNGTAAGSSGGKITFDPLLELQRMAVTLSNGVIYLGFGGHCDLGQYHGWLLAYDAQTLQQIGAFTATPNGDAGGIWQAGVGPAISSNGDLYLMTGNGAFDATDFGDSFIRVRRSVSGMQLMDSFTPYNEDYLSQYDLDLGSGGPLLVPGTHLLFGGGKGGTLYLVDGDMMGGFQSSSDSQIVQSWKGANGAIFGSPVYWQGATQSAAYVWSMNDQLRAYPFTGGQFDTTPSSLGTYTSGSTFPSIPTMSVSSHGSDAGSGIVWAARMWDFEGVHQGILHAFDAADVSVELWNSNQYPLRDAIPTTAKYSPPTIAGGKVYLAATYPNQLVVYGLRPSPAVPTPWLDDDVGTVTVPGDANYDAASGSFAVRASGADFYGTSDAYNFVHRQMTGDVQVTAQVTHIDSTNAWAKSMVQIRDSLSPTAPRASTVMMNTVVQFQRRLTDGATTAQVEKPAAPPTWIRVTRHGSVFYSYFSPDGSTWTPLGSDTITMSPTAEVGFGFSSVHAAVSGTATFQHVSVSAPTDLINGCPPYPTPVANPGDNIGGDTWSTYASGFFTNWCTSCHSSTATDRHGAPPGLNWDDAATVRANLPGIRDSVGVSNSMPPTSPLPGCDERLRLLRWVDAGAP